MAVLRVLAVAASTGRVACAFFVGGKLRDWRVSEKAAQSPENAAEMMQRWINELKPNVVVTEKLSKPCLKGSKTKSIIKATSRTAAQNYVLDVSVTPEQKYDNKYDEAEALAKRFPEVTAWVPKRRRIFDNEPRNIVLFEAIALAVVVLRNPSSTMAAGMG